MDLSVTGISVISSIFTVFNAYPNPLTNEITITANNVINNSKMLVFNNTCKFVASFATYSNDYLNMILYLGYLPSEIYFIKLSNKTGQIKLIKK